MIVVREVNIENVIAGTCIAKDVIDDKGNRLVNIGTPLTTSIIQILQKRGIKTVFISVEEKITDEQYEVLRQQIENDIQKLFRGVSSDSFVYSLKDILIQYRLSKI